MANKKQKSSARLRLKVLSQRRQKPRSAIDNNNHSIAKLAALQDVRPLKDLSVLSGGILDDEDVDEMVEEIYAARK